MKFKVMCTPLSGVVHMGCTLCQVFLWFDCTVKLVYVLPGDCSLVVTCWGRANLLVFLYVLFSCVFYTFPCGVLGQVWYLIVSIPDICPGGGGGGGGGLSIFLHT